MEYMREQAVEKINKIGKVSSIVVLVMKILLVAGFVGCLLGMIVVVALPKDFVTFSMNGKADVNVDLSAFGVELPAESIEQSIRSDMKKDYLAFGNAGVAVDEVQVTDSEINISGSGQLMHFSIRNCVYPILAGMVIIVMSFITLVFAGRLTKAFAKCQSPFDEAVIQSMKRFAYSLIPWTVISGMTHVILSNMFSGGVLQLNLTVNAAYIFVALIILALAYIFQYGAELQKESDETL